MGERPTPREAVFFIYGYARGDEAKVRAIMDGLVAATDNGSLRAVAARHGFAESTVRPWIREVREAMAAAAGRVGVVMGQVGVGSG